MKLQPNTKVLCLLDDVRGRDMEIVFPVLYFAQKFLNCEIQYANVWDSHLIYTKRPDVVFLPNTIGSHFYFEASRYAYQMGIKVFALVSEGNIRTDGSFRYWGYNIDHFIYQDYLCHWSHRSLEFLKGAIPEQKDKHVYTGGTGLDRYQINEFETLEGFCERKKLKPYKKAIGYAAWSFGKLFNELGRWELLNFKDPNIPDRLTWMENMMYQVEAILEELVKNNSDTLFLFKRHPNAQNPAVAGEGMNEIIRLKKYDNVLYLKEDEHLHDLISMSDIWLAFESTTAMEAWALGKTTLLVNPEIGFKRDKIYQGSLIVKKYEDLQSKINEFYEFGRVKDFETEEKKDIRKKLISDSIGSISGLNHIRAAYYLKQTIDRSGNKPLMSRVKNKFFIRKTIADLGKLIYNKSLFLRLPLFRKTIWVFEKRNVQKSADEIIKQRKEWFDRFYESKNIQKIISDENAWKNI